MEKDQTERQEPVVIVWLSKDDRKLSIPSHTLHMSKYLDLDIVKITSNGQQYDGNQETRVLSPSDSKRPPLTSETFMYSLISLYTGAHCTDNPIIGNVQVFEQIEGESMDICMELYDVIGYYDSCLAVWAKRTVIIYKYTVSNLPGKALYLESYLLLPDS